MEILIIGENKINSSICDYFVSYGIKTYIVSDVFDIKQLTGEVGNFILRTKTDEVKANYVILTEQPKAKPAEIAGLSTYSVFDENKEKIHIRSLNPGKSEPIVFLLDYIDESPGAATVQALNDAAMFANKKQPVYYFARFIRTAGPRIEVLYKTAREAGVNFIKYEDLQITSDSNDESFHINSSEIKSSDEFNYEIKTSIIYSDGGWDVGERFSYIVKKFKLTTNELCQITEDNFFLTPALTSRRGVFHITRDYASQRFNEALDFIYLQIKQDSCEVLSTGHVEINEKKCVFCNNCRRACPHAALEPDMSAGKMKCLENACQSCGICINICPAKAISLKSEEEAVQNNNIFISSDPNAINDRRLILYCKNSGGTDVNDLFADTKISSKNIDLTELSCGGQITSENLFKYLNEYSDILCILCPDNACRHFTGNKRTCASINRLNKMISSTGLLKTGITIKQISPGMPKILQEEIKDFIL